MFPNLDPAHEYKRIEERPPICDWDVDGARLRDADTGNIFTLVRGGSGTGWGAKWDTDPEGKKPLPIAAARLLRARPVEEQ